MITRGDVWWVNFGPSIGGEVRKKRPAVVVSNDASNRHLNRIQVVPMTTKTDRIYPSEALVTFLGKRAKAMADQIMTVSKERLMQKAGLLSQEQMNRVIEAIKIQMDL